MRVAIITDQHFGVRGDSVHFLDYYEKFYSETFFPTLKAEGITTLLILGDTFENRKTINFNTLHRAKVMFFDKLEKTGIQVHMLVGNHDAHFKNTIEVNSPELVLDSYSNINTINAPTTITLGGFDVCMMPWICSDNVDASKAELDTSTASTCMGHFEISGFAMHRGMESEEGLDPKVFNRFKTVFSGHYHHKSTKGNITYLGNPTQTTWSDHGDVRGFHIFDLETSKLEFFANPITMFHKLVYDDSMQSEEELTKFPVEEYTGRYVKVIVTNKSNPILFDQYLNRLYAATPLDISLVEDGIDLTDVLEDDTIDEAEDTVTIISKFIDFMVVEGIDALRAKGNMRELYVEALNKAQE